MSMILFRIIIVNAEHAVFCQGGDRRPAIPASSRIASMFCPPAM
jgi:hypothetical protein